MKGKQYRKVKRGGVYAIPEQIVPIKPTFLAGSKLTSLAGGATEIHPMSVNYSDGGQLASIQKSLVMTTNQAGANAEFDAGVHSGGKKRYIKNHKTKSRVRKTEKRTKKARNTRSHKLRKMATTKRRR